MTLKDSVRASASNTIYDFVHIRTCRYPATASVSNYVYEFVWSPVYMLVSNSISHSVYNHVYAATTSNDI